MYFIKEYDIIEKNYEKKEYRQMAENKKEKNGVSIFGVVISVLMIILATLTITINVCFGAGSSLKFGNKAFYLLESGGIVNIVDNQQIEIEKDTMIISNTDEINNLQKNNLILCDIAGKSDVFRIKDIQENAGNQKIYTISKDLGENLTVYNIQQDNVIGLCKKTSTELGAVVAFLRTTVGKVVCAVVPIVLLLLTFITWVVGSRRLSKEEQEEFEREETERKKAESPKRPDPVKPVEPIYEPVQQKTEKTEAPVFQQTEHRQVKNPATDKTIKFNIKDIPLYTPENIVSSGDFERKKATISENFGSNPLHNEETTNDIEVQRETEAKVAEIKQAIQQRAESHKTKDEAKLEDILVEEPKPVVTIPSSRTIEPQKIIAVPEKPVPEPVREIPAGEPSEENQKPPVKKVVKKKKPKKQATFEDIMNTINAEESKLK